MKSLLIAAVVAFGLYVERDTIADLFAPAPDLGPIEAGDVVLLATSWCGYCAKTRTFFAEHGIEYVEFDVEKSEEGRARFEALGARGVPVVLIQDRVIRGYNPSKLERLLL